MNIWSKWRMQLMGGLAIIQLVAIFVLVGMVFVGREDPAEGEWLNEPVVTEQEVVSEMSEEESVQWVVDVKGAVAYPGIYNVDANMRIQHVIDLAGGVLPEAETNQLNFSQHLSDQMMIYVPVKGEVPEEEEATPNVTVPGLEDSTNQKININKASESELQALPGIGEKKALQITQFRSENGSFGTIEELMEVSGIGQKTFEALKELVTVAD